MTLKNTVRAKLAESRLYVIFDPNDPKLASVEECIVEAARGGADIIQLRDKKRSDAQLLPLARRWAALAHESGMLFIVNDRPKVAVLSGADGVHVGQDDASVSEARLILGSTGLVGKSTHSMDQALKAVKEGADYIGLGPIFATPTKPEYGCIGKDLIRDVVSKVGLPVFAIGGIDLSNLEEVLDAGATHIAVVRAVTHAADKQAAARALKETLVNGVLRPGKVF